MSKHNLECVAARNIPMNLENHPFYGYELDDEQKAFRDAIWNPAKSIVFANARSGAGKTFVALGTANLLYEYGLYDGVVYITSPTQEQKQGFLPGGLEEKSAPYMEPLFEALISIGLNPSQVVDTEENIQGRKNGTAFVQCITHTYLRGVNFEHKVVIIDECQNFYLSDLKKTLTRIHDSCKTIVIGHTGQKDLYRHPENSGFAQAINLYQSTGDSRVTVCELTTNHRGWVSTIADQLESEIR